MCRYLGLTCQSDCRIFDVVAAVTDLMQAHLLVDATEGVVAAAVADVTVEVDIDGTNWKWCPMFHAVVNGIDAETWVQNQQPCDKFVAVVGLIEA